ncbi:MAG: DUF2807 domain-containing protein [Candidatus Zixiibacteriota bacterium]|nr:MAG: DUF2807 domain-containing protein [candidate division Zixibacteria bacterium]
MKKSILCLFAVVMLAVSSVSADDFLSWITGRDCIEGSGDLVTQERDLDEFTAIDLKGSTDVFVTVGGEQKVSITIDDNLVDLIETEVRGKTLKIYCEDSYSSRRGCRIEITMPVLEEVRISGSGDAEIYDLDGDYFEYSVSGSGDMRADGEVGEVNIRVSGSGDVDTRDLRAREATVKISGSGDVKVYASETFYGRVSGSGDIDVYGSPERMSRHVSGSGDITKRR